MVSGIGKLIRLENPDSQARWDWQARNSKNKKDEIVCQ